MANKRISDLTSLITPTGTDVFPLASQGATYKVSINDFSYYMTGEFNATFATNTRLRNTGEYLTSALDSFSGLFTGYTGTLDNTFATDTQLTQTGQRITNTINLLSGNAAVLTYGEQTISGLKNFRTGINIFNFRDPQSIRVFNATGTNSGEFGLLGWQNDTFILGTQRSVHGSLRDSLITGRNIIIQPSGDIILRKDLYVTGNIYISGNQAITGVDLSSYALDSNLTLTGSGLQVNIDNLYLYSVFTTGNQTISGFKTFTTGIDIYNETAPQRVRIFNTTGINSGEFAILGWENNNFIFGSRNSFSGILRDITITGRNINFIPLERSIFRKDLLVSGGYVFISGQPVLTGQTNLYAINTNLLNTGMSLLQRINSLSGSASVLTYGNQDINGLKTFKTGIILENQNIPQFLNIYNTTGENSGELATLSWRDNRFIIGAQNLESGILRDLILTGSNIIVSPSGQSSFNNDIFVTGNIYLSGQPVLTGQSNLYEFKSDGIFTGKYLDDKIDSLSGSAVLRYSDQFITGGYKNFSGQSVIVNFNSGALLQVSGITVTPREYATKNLALLYAIAI